jgi:hypothetical protein
MPLLPPLTEEGLPEIERQAEKFAEQTLIKVSLLLRR